MLFILLCSISKITNGKKPATKYKCKLEFFCLLFPAVTVGYHWLPNGSALYFSLKLHSGKDWSPVVTNGDHWKPINKKTPLHEYTLTVDVERFNLINLRALISVKSHSINYMGHHWKRRRKDIIFIEIVPLLVDLKPRMIQNDLHVQ